MKQSLSKYGSELCDDLFMLVYKIKSHTRVYSAHVELYNEALSQISDLKRFCTSAPIYDLSASFFSIRNFESHINVALSKQVWFKKLYDVYTYAGLNVTSVNVEAESDLKAESFDMAAMLRNFYARLLELKQILEDTKKQELANVPSTAGLVMTNQQSLALQLGMQWLSGALSAGLTRYLEEHKKSNQVPTYLNIAASLSSQMTLDYLTAPDPSSAIIATATKSLFDGSGIANYKGVTFVANAGLLGWTLYNAYYNPHNVITKVTFGVFSFAAKSVGSKLGLHAFNYFCSSKKPLLPMTRQDTVQPAVDLSRKRH